MRIGIDARPLSGKVTGIGRYVLEILNRMPEHLPHAEWVLYSRTPVSVKLPPGDWRFVTDPSFVGRRIPGVFWIKSRLPSLMRRDGLDVFWATFSISPNSPVPVVSTVYDLNHLVVPETMRFVHRVGYARWFAKDVLRADQVICISRGTALRLKQAIGREMYSVALPGCQWAQMGRRDLPAPVSEPYVLSVATREPRKNLNNLIEAFAALKAQGHLAQHVLVLAGGAGWGAPLKALRSGRPEWLRELGYVPDAEMAALFANADVLVQPSIYEGFGMPAAEAAALGTRVLATDMPELREAAGSTGVYIGTGVRDIAEGLLHALALPPPLPHAGNSWSDAAAVTAEALRQAANAGHVA